MVVDQGGGKAGYGKPPRLAEVEDQIDSPQGMPEGAVAA